MNSHPSSTFQDALNAVETLPDEQQESLIEIVRHRLIDRCREEIAESVQTAREEYARGEVQRGSVEELIGELSE